MTYSLDQLGSNLLRKTHFKFIAFFLLLMVCVFSFSGKAKAVYDGANIIDNGFFLNAQAMGIAEIQNFLVSKGSGLANRGFVLDCYGPSSQERQWYTAAGAPCDQTVPAADIIYYASQIYGINPRVVLATLQKEQSLVTSPNPTDWQINQAMGYGCPTTGGCGASNFFYQIDSGVWVLRYHYERANGNNTWWNNGGYTCGTPKNFYNPGLWPGTNVTFYDEDGVAYRTYLIANAATASLYCYTPHAYNNPQGLYGLPVFGNVGRYYTGSYNFVYWYEQWFGGTQTGRAFKASNSDAIYYSVGNYKLSVPQMGVLQDYGISPESIRTLTPEVVNATPSPPAETGISSTIGSLIKSPSDTDEDGGSVYLVSVGKRYQITDMGQFANFGFQESSIKYLPLSFINNMSSAGALSNFVYTPNGAVFEVGSGTKRIIFEYATYIQRNPADRISFFSYYLADLLTSGVPLSNRELLLKTQGSEAVYLLSNGNYYSMTFNSYNCWGFAPTLKTPLYRVVSNSYISPINVASQIECKFNDGSKEQILSQNVRFEIPASYGIPTSPVLNSDLISIANKIPMSASPLKQYIKSSDSASVWFLEGGLRKVIPTYSNFVLLGLSGSQLDIINSYAMPSMPAVSGIKLGSGQLVKPDNSSEVFVISNNSRVSYTSSDKFLAYRNDWGDIETYSAAILDQAYPYNSVNVKNYLYDESTLKSYIIDPNGCYYLDTDLLLSYGQDSSNIASNQNYLAAIFIKLDVAACATGSTFVKQPGQSTVYWVDGGSKHLISKWDTLVSKSGTSNPYVLTLSSNFLSTLPTGTPLD
jgi:hypothetical protein